MKERRGEGGKVRARAGAGKGETYLSLWWVTQPSNTTQRGGLTGERRRCHSDGARFFCHKHFFKSQQKSAYASQVFFEAAESFGVSNDSSRIPARSSFS